MDCTMENQVELASLEPNDNNNHDSSPNSEEDFNVLKNANCHLDECQLVTLAENSLREECINSLDGTHNFSSHIGNGHIDENPSVLKDKEKNLWSIDEENSAILKDSEGNDAEILAKNTSFLEDCNTPEDNEIFPKSAENNPSIEDELAFHKGIFEDSSNDETPVDDQPADNALLSTIPSTNEDDEEDDDVAFDVEERGNEHRSSKKELSLPYFQLPKPDLDEFLLETEKNLRIDLPTGVNKTSGLSSVDLKPKPQKDIVTLKPPMDSEGNLIDPKEAFITIDLSSDALPIISSKKEMKVLKTSPDIPKKFNNEYEKVLSSFKMDESETPGIKRLALKEFLKKQIDQKKYEAFNHAKLLHIEDEEMDLEEVDKEEEALETDSEDSSEECEEATVTFPINNEDPVENLDSEAESVPTNKPEEVQLDDEDSNDESDDDFIGVKKSKKKFLVLDEDSGEEDSLDAHDKDNDSLGEKSTSFGEIKMPKSVENELNGDVCEKENFELNKDIEPHNSKDNSSGGVIKTSESNILSQISSSMPSYQPGGGFLSEAQQQEDSSDSLASSLPSINNINEDSNDSYAQEEKLLGSRRTPVSKDESFKHNDNNGILGIKLGDLSVSQEDDSNIFLTNELADVCSGAFDKRDAVSEKDLEDVEDDDEELPPEAKITDFFDDEAELSGEDDGVDERDDSDGEGVLDILAPEDEDLPAAEVLREEIADLHMKRIKDDDEELLREIQEQFLDDGELNNEGAGRSRRFAWIHNDADIGPDAHDSDSDSDADLPDDSLSSLNQEKVKWRQENKDDDEDLTEDLNSSGCQRRSFLKVNIIGKPRFSEEGDLSKRLSCKRPRGSFLNLDDSAASQVLKKLKASEDNAGGSRTTKHFVFRNDMPSDSASTKNEPRKSTTANSPSVSALSQAKSIFHII